jgi:hypothetical protein
MTAISCMTSFDPATDVHNPCIATVAGQGLDSLELAEFLLGELPVAPPYRQTNFLVAKGGHPPTRVSTKPNTVRTRHGYRQPKSHGKNQGLTAGLASAFAALVNRTAVYFVRNLVRRIRSDFSKTL